jgi:hypothetical protein
MTETCHLWKGKTATWEGWNRIEEMRKKRRGENYLSSRTFTDQFIRYCNMYACRAVVNTVMNCMFLREAGNYLTICEKLLASNGVLLATALVNTYVITSWFLWTFRHVPPSSNCKSPSLWCIISDHHPPLPLHPIFFKLVQCYVRRLLAAHCCTDCMFYCGGSDGVL